MKVEVNFFAFSHQLKKSGPQFWYIRQPALHMCQILPTLQVLTLIPAPRSELPPLMENSH